MHCILHKYDDDIIDITESKTDFYIFYFDCDVSDCSLYRISKETFPTLDIDLFRSLYLDKLRTTFGDWRHDSNMSEAIIVPIPAIPGWYSW